MKVTNLRLVSVRAKTVLTAVLVVSSCVDFVKGGCLSYGHSCWGGHGKRSGSPGRGAIVVRTMPAPPLQSQDAGLWSSNVRKQLPIGMVRGSPDANNYYPQMSRLFQVPPADVMEFVGSNDATGPASTSDENDSDNSKPASDDEETGFETFEPRPRTINSRKNQLRLKQQRRRKTALLRTAPDRSEPSDNSDEDDDFGQLVMSAGDRERNDNLPSLSNSPQNQKYSRSS